MSRYRNAGRSWSGIKWEEVNPDDEDLNHSSAAGASSSSTNRPISNFRKTEDDNLIVIDIESAISLKGYRHAVHCMFWAKWKGRVLKSYDTRAAIMMQMRFDGTFGFPGGMVDTSMDDLNSNEGIEQVVAALNRELQEEMNLDLAAHKISQSNYMFSDKSDKNKIVLHFYQYEMTIEDFVQVEKNASTSEEFGDEVFGVCRVPLYTMIGKGNYFGFPAFLDNVFAGNASDQLVRALVALEIMTTDEIELAQSARRRPT